MLSNHFPPLKGYLVKRVVLTLIQMNLSCHIVCSNDVYKLPDEIYDCYDMNAWKKFC